MLKSVQHNQLAPEGYVYTTYGHPKYLKHAVASVVSPRRYDEERMALSKLDLPVYPWLQGHTSPHSTT